MVAGDGVQERQQHVVAEAALSGGGVDHAHAGDDVADHAPFVGDGDRHAGAERLGAADVVQERRREQDVGVEARVELGRLAAERRDGHGVLEEAAGVVVVGLRRGRRPQPLAQPRVVEHAAHQSAQAVVVDLGREELEEPLERVGVAPRARDELERVAALDPLEVAHRDLEPPAVGLDLAEHPDRVALVEPGPEQVHVVPDDARDAARPVGQLDRQEGVAVARRAPELALDGERCVDHGPLGQVGHVGAPGHPERVY